MKSIQEMTQSELGAFVHTFLRDAGIHVVLSGGAAVSIYSKNEYISKDLDFVNIFSVSRPKICSAMNKLGFEEQGRYFKHPLSQYFIEFPPGPLSVGIEPIKEIKEVIFSTGVLRVISPTDCVKDRLAAYYHWGDRQTLQQAILVAKNQQIDLKEIEKWSKTEGKLKDFKEILSRLKKV